MSEQQEKYIRIINKNSSELMYFVGKLLELSQTESALKEPDKKTLDVLALVNSVVRFNEQLYKGKEVKISIKPEEDFKKTISTDEEILKAYKLIASCEGVLAEPASAASVAGLIKVKDTVKSGSKIVCILTGNGLKDPDNAIKYANDEVKKTSADMTDILRAMNI
ncbi:pyridoxal-phosphate dependent enzyme [bacterium]|nr:pyridoxal-phosphate dependent enzyme [bacterium]